GTAPAIHSVHRRKRRTLRRGALPRRAGMGRRSPGPVAASDGFVEAGCGAFADLLQPERSCVQESAAHQLQEIAATAMARLSRQPDAEQPSAAAAVAGLDRGATAAGGM